MQEEGSGEGLGPVYEAMRKYKAKDKYKAKARGG